MVLNLEVYIWGSVAYGVALTLISAGLGCAALFVRRWADNDFFLTPQVWLTALHAVSNR